MRKSKIICLIPIRLNSKRIKNKNFVKINNSTLLKIVSGNVSKSKLIDKFYIASEKSQKVENIVNKYKNFNFFVRSKKSCKDNAKTEVVIDEFLKNIDCKILVLLQTTNPFIKYIHIDNAIKKFKRNSYDTLLSVVSSKHFLWKKSNLTSPLNYNIKNRKMSQYIKKYYVENGSFYIFYKSKFVKFKNRLHGKIGVYEMPKESFHEIDDHNDLNIVRKLLK